MATKQTFTPAQNRPSQILSHVASVQCHCGAVHHSADGRVPMGWTVSRGEAFCADCTRAGIPARLITAPAPKPRTAKSNDERIRLRSKVIDLLIEGQALMPSGSKKRSDWVARVNAMLADASQAAA